MKLSIGKAWEETSAFLGREARLVAPVALATFALPAILVDWAYPGGNRGQTAALVMLLVLLIVLVGQMTIILLANGWRGRIGEAMSKAARRLPSLFGALMIVFLPLALIAAFAIGGLLVSAGITNPAAIAPEQLQRLTGVAWIAFIVAIVAIFLGVRMFALTAAAASETGGAVALIKRSWHLTRGVFWRLLALVLLLGLGGAILNYAVIAVAGSIATLAAGEPRAFSLSALIVALFAGVVGALVSTVSAAMAGRVYAQLNAPTASVPNS